MVIQFWLNTSHRSGTHYLIRRYKMNNAMNITTMSELLESFREYLDECCPEVSVFGCMFEPSRVLEELDPVAFRQGYLDYADAVEIDLDELEDDL